MEALVLRFEAPMYSFGGPAVDDARGPTQAYPARSMLTGLIGNALGYRRQDAERLSSLQDRLRVAARRDWEGERFTDYQTVDLSQPFLQAEQVGWTTWGYPDTREGGEAGRQRERRREYFADTVYTVALTLDPAEERPSLATVAEALRRPERPLYLGRKCCLPAAPLLRGQVAGESLFGILKDWPRRDPETGRAVEGLVPAWWDEEVAEDEGERTGLTRTVTDTRDWENQLHVGQRRVHQGEIMVTGGAEDG